MTRTEREFGVKPEELGLHPVALRETAGLLWISLADDSPDFDSAAHDIAGRLRHQGMDRAKVAKRVTYTVKANWKLVFENTRSCGTRLRPGSKTRAAPPRPGFPEWSASSASPAPWAAGST
jgi:hypothetical protein